METEEAQAAIQRLQAALIRQGELAGQIDPTAGPRDSGNLAILVEIYAAHDAAQAAAKELIDLGVLPPDVATGADHWG